MSDESEWIPAQTNNIDAMRLQLAAAPKADTLEEYYEALASYVELRWNLMSLGCSLVDLNRRFVKLSVKLGKTPREIVMDLVIQGRLSALPWQRKFIVFPKADFSTHCQLLEQTNIETYGDHLEALYKRSYEE